jgi:hypothetical protein
MILNNFFNKYYIDAYSKCEDYIYEYNLVKNIMNTFDKEVINGIIIEWIKDYENGNKISGPKFTMEVSNFLDINDQILERDFMIEASVRDYIINKTGKTINYNTNDEGVCKQFYKIIKKYALPN